MCRPMAEKSGWIFLFPRFSGSWEELGAPLQRRLPNASLTNQFIVLPMEVV